jgi:hypothetical protein
MNVFLNAETIYNDHCRDNTNIKIKSNEIIYFFIKGCEQYEIIITNT